MSATPPTKRRWFQFSLRTLMLLMLLACVGMGWVVARMQKVKRQREAVETVAKVGGWLEYDYQFDSSGRHKPEAEPPGPKWLRKLLGNDFFANVVWVIQGNIMVTDARLEHLRRLTQLKYLSLYLSKITDAGLEHLRGLTQLQYLDLEGTQIEDAGLEHLQGLTQLQYLDLSHTKVTDAGLDHLIGLSKLQVLRLYRTKVTNKGVKKLQQAIPNCEIGR